MQYTPPPHVTQHWQLSKPSAKGRRGMVVSQAKGAAEAGVAVLDAGGNAIDAAVATALALATHEPWNSGLGGIGFALVHRAGQKRAEVVDFGPRAPRRHGPRALPADRPHDHGPVRVARGRGRHQHPRPAVGRHPVLGRRLRLHAPAMGQAAAGRGDRTGHRAGEARPAAGLVHRAEGRHVRVGDPALSDDGERLSAERAAAGAALSGQARLLPPGQPAGRRWSASAKAGLRDFYEGDIAASVAADIKALGGVVSLDDLRNCQARTWPAEEVGWRGRTLQLTGGLTAAPTLKRVLEGMADAPYGGAAPSAAWYRALARVMKAAYAERLAGLGESEPLAAESCTTHLTACDAEGNTVAMTTTLMSSFGSRVLLPQSGVLLNNGMMWFDPRPGMPNSIAPGKRPLCNMLPIMLTENGRPFLAGGRLGRAAHHGGGVPADDVHRGFRHGRGDGGASSAHRRLQRRQRQRRPPAACRRCSMRWRRTVRWRSSSTARCRSTSPARM